MMLNEKYQNSSCGFAEELVSYLYDELKSAEKSRFERHLKTCSACTDEIASFGIVRNSVTDWRKADFDSLPTPLIEIPYHEKVKTVAVTPISPSWFENIRALFTLSPAWMTAATAVAVLAIGVGLGIVLINSLRDGFNEIVQENKVKPVSSPTMENKTVNSTSSEENQATPNPSQSPTPTLSKDNSVIPSVPSVSAKTGGKSNASTSPNLDLKKTVAPKDKVTPKSKQQKVPRLIDDDDEDDSLRLSDIFNEIGIN